MCGCRIVALQQSAIDSISQRLLQVAPSASWLKNSTVEKCLGLSDGAISTFLKSIQPQQRGSTRQQTRVSTAQKGLVQAGLFFKPGHVAVAGPLAPQPFWGGATKSDISDTVLRIGAHSPSRDKAGREPCEGVSSGAIPATPPCSDAVSGEIISREPVEGVPRGAVPAILPGSEAVEIETGKEPVEGVPSGAVPAILHRSDDFETHAEHEDRLAAASEEREAVQALDRDRLVDIREVGWPEEVTTTPGDVQEVSRAEQTTTALPEQPPSSDTITRSAFPAQEWRCVGSSTNYSESFVVALESEG